MKRPQSLPSRFWATLQEPPTDCGRDLSLVPYGRVFLRSDITVTSHCHLLFATKSQLKILKNTKTCYMDGTFKLVQELFKQLFSISAFVCSGESTKQFPLVFVIMSGKSAQDYKEVCMLILCLK